jgi:hypothetical protein
MTTLPPLSAASDAVVKAILAKTVEIQSSGDLSAIADGYRVCAALTIRTALQIATGTGPIRAEDVLENLQAIANNLDPEVTAKERLKNKADAALEILEDYATDSYEAGRAMQSLRAVLYDLTHLSE